MIFLGTIWSLQISRSVVLMVNYLMLTYTMYRTNKLSYFSDSKVNSSTISSICFTYPSAGLTYFYSRLSVLLNIASDEGLLSSKVFGSIIYGYSTSQWSPAKVRLFSINFNYFSSLSVKLKVPILHKRPPHLGANLVPISSLSIKLSLVFNVHSRNC